MDKNFLIQLTASIYRLTLLFPKKEPLRYKMRELADDILADLIFLPQNPEEIPQSEKSTIVEIYDRAMKNLEILDCFFAIAREQNWVSISQFVDLQREYSKIREELEAVFGRKPRLPLKGVILSKEEEAPKDKKNSEIKESLEITSKMGVMERNGRQGKILEVLKEKGKAQVGEFKEIFPQVTKRTIRRDFRQLLKQGLIQRIGERNETFYQLADRTEIGHII